MELNKQITILRKRNADLQEQLNKNKETVQRATDLIKELEDIKYNWNEELNKLKAQRQEYAKLNAELKDIKDLFSNIIV